MKWPVVLLLLAACDRRPKPSARPDCPRDSKAGLIAFDDRYNQMLAKQAACGDPAIRGELTLTELRAQILRFNRVWQCRTDALNAWIAYERSICK